MTTEKRDCYEILEIPKNATEQDIKIGFRKLARKYHPDVSTDANASDKFKELNEAYSILSDPEKKQLYDQHGYEAFNGQQMNSHNFGNLNDFMNGLFNMGNLFDTRRHGHYNNQDKNIIHTVNLTFNEAIHGCKKTFTYNINKICKFCNGNGGTDITTCKECSGKGFKVIVMQTMIGQQTVQSMCDKCKATGKTYKKKCAICNEKGFIKKQVNHEIDVPSGIHEAVIIQCESKGHEGAIGERNGDLILKFTVMEHKIFIRENYNIKLILPVYYNELILGCTKKIPTIHGFSEIVIPKNSNNGDIITLKNMGIINSCVSKSDKEKEKGDMLIHLKLVIPKNLTDEYMKIIKSLDDLRIVNDEYNELMKK